MCNVLCHIWTLVIKQEGDKINIPHIIEIILQNSHYFYGKLWTG